MYTLAVDTEQTPHGEERIVFESGTPLAVALVDEDVPDFTLSWPVAAEVRVDEIMQEWLTGLLPGYGVRSGTATLEFYVGEHFHQERIRLPTSARVVFQSIRSQFVTARDELNFLLINAQNNVFEACFGPNGVCTQVACIHSEARLQSLIRVFKPFHASHLVRADQELSLQILGDNAAFAGAIDLLKPVLVIP